MPEYFFFCCQETEFFPYERYFYRHRETAERARAHRLAIRPRQPIGEVMPGTRPLAEVAHEIELCALFFPASPPPSA